MLIYPKNKDIILAKGLTLKEFQCKCNYPECNIIIISKKLVDGYDFFRKVLALPLQINSGHRCLRHNKNIGGAPLSRHLSGQAIDVAYNGPLEGKYLSKQVAYIALEYGFTFVKYIDKDRFFHFDVR